MLELEFATTDEILAELSRRYRGVVLLTLKDAEGKTNDPGEECGCFYRGGWTLCFGLVARTAARFAHQEAIGSVHISEDHRADGDADDDDTDDDAA